MDDGGVEGRYGESSDCERGASSASEGVGGNGCSLQLVNGGGNGNGYERRMDSLRSTKTMPKTTSKPVSISVSGGNVVGPEEGSSRILAVAKGASGQTGP